MRTSVADVRRLIAEAAKERDIEEYDNVHVGDWFVNKRGAVCRLSRLYYRHLGTNYGDVLLADTQGAGATVTQRFDVWAKDAQPATHDQVQDAQEAWGAEENYKQRTIDTGHEGT